MFNQTDCKTGTSRTQPQPGQPQLHLLPSNSAASSAIAPDLCITQVRVKLSGRLAAAPSFQPVSGESGVAQRVELYFLSDQAVDRFGSSGSPEPTTTNPDPALGYVKVWCDGWQFSKVATSLTPQTQLQVEGKPLAMVGQYGEPRLVVICSSLRIVSTRPTLPWSWSWGKTRLGLCWASIFGGILLLQILLPKFMPPGLLPLAILLGGMRLVEGSGFVPAGFRSVLRGCLVKILLFAALVIALWLLVQFSYFTTLRFR